MSAIGTKRTYRVALHMSATRGTADIRLLIKPTIPLREKLRPRATYTGIHSMNMPFACTADVNFLIE